MSDTEKFKFIKLREETTCIEVKYAYLGGGAGGGGGGVYREIGRSS